MIEAPDRKIAPAIKDPTEFNLLLKPCDTFFLDNGTPVYYLNDGAEEVASIEFVFAAGNSFENKNLVAAVTNYLLKNGTTKKNAFEITEHFDYYGAHFTRGAQHEYASIYLNSLSKHLKELLPVVREVITESIFPQQELEIYQQNAIQRFLVNLQKCDFVAGRIIDKSLYGEKHPYGRMTSAEDMKALDRSDLLDFYKHFYIDAKCLIFASGRLPADFQQLLNDQFGDLNLNVNHPTITYKRELGDERKMSVINDPNGVQGSIRIARPFPSRHDPDFNKVRVLNMVFGGYFGSRLMANIREDKGFTYGIHSYLENQVQQNAWMISTEAGKDVCEAAVKEVYKEMKKLREVPIDEEELSLVKNYMMGLNLGNLDGPFKVIARWKDLVLHGLDAGNYYDYIDTIKNVSADELQELSNKYLLPQEFFELIVV